jgi:Neuraminidase (sialidase)
MAKHRSFVYMTIEWDDVASNDPRKWDWDAIVSNDGSGDRVTNVGTYRILQSMTDDGVRDLMDEVTTVAGDIISDYQPE